jgi:hypothetical protein
MSMANEGFAAYLVSVILVPIMSGGMSSVRRSGGVMPAMRSV